MSSFLKPMHDSLQEIPVTKKIPINSHLIETTENKPIVIPFIGGEKLLVGNFEEETTMKNHSNNMLTLKLFTHNSKGEMVEHPEVSIETPILNREYKLRTLEKKIQEKEVHEIMRALSLLKPEDIDLASTDPADYNQIRLIDAYKKHFKIAPPTQEEELISLDEYKVALEKLKQNYSNQSSPEFDEALPTVRKYRVEAYIQLESFTQITEIFIPEELPKCFKDNPELMFENNLQSLLLFDDRPFNDAALRVSLGDHKEQLLATTDQDELIKFLISEGILITKPEETYNYLVHPKWCEKTKEFFPDEDE